MFLVLNCLSVLQTKLYGVQVLYNRKTVYKKEHKSVE
jgi:hypothetical protein